MTWIKTKSGIIALNDDKGNYSENLPGESIQANEQRKFLVHLVKWAKKMNFSIINNLHAENFNSRHEFLTTMVFRANMPDELLMKIKFFDIEAILYRKISEKIYALIYQDYEGNISFSLAIKKKRWTFRYEKFSTFKKNVEGMIIGGDINDSERNST